MKQPLLVAMNDLFQINMDNPSEAKNGGSRFLGYNLDAPCSRIKSSCIFKQPKNDSLGHGS
ncbi:MAG: hypothetical protein R2788_11080 [Saprospiraceae bacterium]